MSVWEKNAPVWVRMPKDPTYPEKAGKVVKSTEAETEVKILPGWENTPGKIKLTAGSDYELLPMSLPAEGVEDMMKLTDLYVGALLHNLKIRFNKNIIATYIGQILVVVNPFHKVEDAEGLNIVGDEYKVRYQDCVLSEMPPHTFALADTAYQVMVRESRNMSVVISGESGAGKSESTKHVLAYLAHRSAAAAGSGEISPIEEQIVQTSLVLEAFGNACTTRNNNSSRFGKFVEVQFEDGVIVGAKIEQYLLEKSRIVTQSKDERNYHIFYDIFFYDQDVVQNEWHLTKSTDYAYLNQGKRPIAPGIDDEEDFTTIVRPFMTNLGISEEVQKQLFTVIAAIIHIGEITMTERPGADGEPAAEVANHEALELVAHLLQVDVARMEHALTHREIVTPSQVITKELTPQAALDNRDAFAKGIYQKLFVDLVERINVTVANDGGEDAWIGVLDIFGFEHFHLHRPSDDSLFPNNSFEQLCINFANEMLQNFFNEAIFKQEKILYDEEGVDVDQIEFNNNDACIDLIKGMLKLLDEKTNMPGKITNLDVLGAFHRKWSTSDRGNAREDQGILTHEEHRTDPKQYYGKLMPNKWLTDSTDFVVAHYAGDVQYSICKENLNLKSNPRKDNVPDPDLCGFIEKNKDKMVDLFVELVKDSEMEYLRHLFAHHKATKTVAYIFRSSLDELIGKLRSTQPYFIRCVKPNPQKKPKMFVNDMVLSQLRAAGMLETINIRNAGFPQRMTPEAFMSRYDLLVPLIDDINANTDPEEATAAILEWVDEKYPGESGPVPFVMGNTLVFMKEHLLHLLERERSDAKAKIDAIKRVGVGHLQAIARMYLEYAQLDERREEYKRNEARIIRLRELVAQGMSKEEAKALIAKEEEEERRRIEEEKRLATVGPLEEAAASAMQRAPELLQQLKSVVSGTHDPEQKKAVNPRKKTLEAALKIVGDAMKALGGKGWQDAAKVAAADKAVKALSEIVDTESTAAPAAVAEMEKYIAEEEQRKAEAEARRKAEEAARKAEEAARRRAAKLAAQLKKEAQARAEAERKALQAERKRVAAARKRVEEMRAAVEAEQARIQESINSAKAEHERLEAERERLLELKRERDAEKQRRKEAKEKEEAQRKMIQSKKDRIVKKQAMKRRRIEERKELAKTTVLQGIRVLWKCRRATIRYCGRLPIAKSDDVWLGLEMNKALKKGIGNDGSCMGVQFFRCKPNHGLFVRAERVMIVDVDAKKQVGTRVYVNGQRGVVRYLGEVYMKEGQWVGIELDKQGAGKNDGLVHEHRYFSCPPKTGIFVRPTKVDVARPWSEQFVHDLLLEYCIEQNLLTDDDLREVVEKTKRDVLGGDSAIISMSE